MPMFPVEISPSRLVLGDTAACFEGAGAGAPSFCDPVVRRVG
jgi:hypothetical protein